VEGVYLYKKGDRTDCIVITRAYHFCQRRTKLYLTSYYQDLLHMQRKLLRIINMDFDATGQLLIIYYASVKYLRRNGNPSKQCISSL